MVKLKIATAIIWCILATTALCAQDRIVTRNGTLIQGAIAYFSPAADSLVICDAAAVVKTLGPDTLSQVWLGEELKLGSPVLKPYWISLGAGFQLGAASQSSDPQIRAELSGGYRLGKLYTGPGAVLSVVNSNLLLSPGWQIRYRMLNSQASPYAALHGALSRNLERNFDDATDHLDRGTEWGAEIGLMKHKRHGGGYTLCLGYRNYSLTGNGTRLVNFTTTVPTTLTADWHRFYLQFSWLL